MAVCRADTLAAGVSPKFDQAQDMTVFPPANHDALFLSDLLTPEEKDVQMRVRKFAVSALLGEERGGYCMDGNREEAIVEL